jgi:serine/threonine protein kinase
MVPGTRVGPYEILSKPGEGGTGQVYRARDPRLQRDVAIKTLAAHAGVDSRFRERFEREARGRGAVASKRPRHSRRRQS